MISMKLQIALLVFCYNYTICKLDINPGPAEPRYALLFETVQIQISQMIWICTICHSV